VGAGGASAARGGLALAALSAILAVTAVWWVLALWPLSSEAPEWLVRTRALCFGSAPDGLPDLAGWIVLIGQPTTMLGILLLSWGDAVRAGLRSLHQSLWGRAVLAVAALAALLGAGAAVQRVRAAPPSLADSVEILPPPETYPQLDRPAPPLRLVNQRGEVVSLEEARGRTVLVTFAYAHCTTVCPLIVNEARRAQEALAEQRPALWVVTLDPWRDTPARLPHLAAAWGLGADAFVLGGTVDDVNAVLDRWDVPRSRDPRTGEIVHPNLVYLVDRNGTLTYAVSGDARQIVSLAGRL
jgi:cytochrome oxidase Cu insertion factor (SCO1/SenC/PrrC family)